MKLPTLSGIWPSSKRKLSDQELSEIIQRRLAEPNNQAVLKKLQNAFKKDPVGVMIQITRNQFSNYSREIDAFKIARAEAKSTITPRRVSLMEFYEDLVLDPFIWGVVYNRRILKISNKNFKICKRGTLEKDNDKTDLLNCMWFNDFLKYAMESRFYGFSLVYFYEWRNARIHKTELVYRDHVIPERNLITKRPYDNDGIIFTDKPYSDYLIGIGNPRDLGLFEKAAIHYVLKKHGWRSWDEFEEIFGIPIRYAKTASQDEKVRAEMEKWLSSMGSASYGLFPADAELEVLESSKTDAFQVFSEKIKLANEELEVLFTGQNRITQKGGAYAKEKVMQDESDEVTEDDKNFIYYLINDELLPLLRRNGYPIGEDDIFEWDDAINEKPVDRMSIFTQIHNMGYKIDKTQVESEFGVKIVGETTKSKEPKGQDGPKNDIDALMMMHEQLQDIYHVR